MDREKLLSALAYQMSTKDYRVCSVMFMGKYLPEKRLVPFLVRVLQESEEDTLMEAVKTAQAIPDPRLLAAIFDHALESVYAQMVFYSDDHGRQVIRKPLFGEAAKAIHIITGGAVGLKEVPDEEKLRSIKQEKLPQWRQWWQENKANWPAAPPLPEKPKEPASPAPKAPAALSAPQGQGDGAQPQEKQRPPKTEPSTDAKPAPAAPPVPPRAKNAPPAIPMREPGELNSVWSEAAARISEDSEAWRKIQRMLQATTGSAPPAKVDAFRLLYDCVRRSEAKMQYVNAAVVLMETGGPAVVRECLLHANSDVVTSACEALLKLKPKQADQSTIVAGQPNGRDFQAVPYLVYVLQRNNFWQDGSEEATVHFILKGRLVGALLYITDTENRAAPVNVDDEQQVDRVLALARKWVAEKRMEPLEKQRPPKAEPPTEPKPAPASAGAATGAAVPKAEAVPRDLGNRRPFIPMKPAEELNRSWQDAAARLPDNAPIWRKLQQNLKICTGAVPTSKEMQLSAMYELVCHNERPNWQSGGALVLLKADIPEVLHELLLHPHLGIAIAACDHLLQQAAKPVGGDKEEPKAESPRDVAAVPFLIFVLNRNNYDQMGSEEATGNILIKEKAALILMQIMGKEWKFSQLNVRRVGDVDRVLALARAWAAEKGLEPLEKQRPPKAFPPREPKPAPA
jgi:hypothetical protein